MSGKKYETVTIQVECEDNLNLDAHIFLFQELIGEVSDVEAVIMTQLSLKAGIKCWKGKGQSAAKYEMKQLHFRSTFKPKHYRDLNEDHKKSILEYYMILKENRYGKIKGRTVEGGKKQREFI